MSEDRLRELFDRAAELSPAERALFLESECAATEDPELVQELRALLAADEAAVQYGAWESSALAHEAAWQSPDGAYERGEMIGRYRILERIGSGGMGKVYLAVRADAEYEQKVAIKRIKPGFAAEEIVARFRSERQILANLEHPNIARLLDGGADSQGMPYLVMEYVEGVAPLAYCQNLGLSVPRRLALFRQICAAVHYAHQRMVVHRDLKPSNILVTAEGVPKLLDFGIAKVLDPDPAAPAGSSTATVLRMMTARYSSPEQVRGEPVTTASDVYSLGVLLYELLTGQSPYRNPNAPAHELMRAVCEEEPPRPSVWAAKLKGDLDNIVLRALRKSPQARYASVDQFSEDILRRLEGRPVRARGDALVYVAARFIRRHRVMVLAAALLLCSLTGGLIEVALARARADRRFNEVRRLAHSVMFDYADAIDRLPGATPVRARLVRDALTYLDNLSKEADTPQLRREIVDAYVRVSNLQGNEYQNNLGDTAAALVSARKAVAAAENVLREDRTPPALGSVADAFSTYGDLLYSTGNLPATGRAYERAIGLRQEIAAKSPGDLGNYIALSICFRHMGDLSGGYGFRSLGKTADALAFYGQGKALVAKLAAQFPGNVDVAKESYKTLLSLSSAESVMGMREEAARDLDEALAQIEKAGATHPNDANIEVELAIAEARSGQMLLDSGTVTSAIPHIARAGSLVRKLLGADPGDAIYRRNQLVVETEWAAALRGAGRISEAVAHNELALHLAQALSRDAPASVQYRSEVGISERKLSEGLLAGGNAARALDHARQAGLILCQNEPSPVDSYNLANCGRALVAAGNAHLALHHPNAAVLAYRKAEKMASALSQADPVNVIFRSDWARSQVALAGGLTQVADYQAARGMYEGALTCWSILRQAKSLSAEDAHRADNAAQALAALRSQR
jgi:tetratricopeptide (TPR) repeat protein